MKPLSTRSQSISPSPTVAMDARYKEMLAAGKSVLSLGAGEPDLGMPEVGHEAILRALREGKTRYSHMAGLPELRQALSQKFSVENGVQYPQAEILVTSGAKQAIFVALMAVINPGDEVIIPSPCWVSYPEAVRLLGGIPVLIETRVTEGFKLNPAELSKAITPHTKILILNSPCNPTGAVYSRHEMEALAEVVVQHDLYLLSDEIYEHITYDGIHCTSPAALGSEIHKRTAVVNGFSKAYAMQGLRLGFIGAPSAWAAAMIAAQSHASHHPSTLSQYAALACLQASKEILPGMRAHYQEARDFFLKRLRGISGLRFNPPEGAFYVFVSIEKYVGFHKGRHKIEGAVALSEYLLEEMELATVPGTGFGREGFIRLSFANPLNLLEMACDRLEKGLGALIQPG